VITYFLLCGYTPFDRDSNLEEMQAILVADYSFTPMEYWRGVSLSARAFIKRCLTIEPTQRMTAHEALAHDWMAGPGQGRGDEQDLLPTVKKNFNARRTLHKAIDTVRAINQLRAGGGMGMGIMDGAQSTLPQKLAAGGNKDNKSGDHNSSSSSQKTATQKDADGDVNMDGGDSRSNARGQTQDQIRRQEKKIQETTLGMWDQKRQGAGGGNDGAAVTRT